jgi:succinate dehydrogenase/fumarate reductase flavoprotein subunit
MSMARFAFGEHSAAGNVARGEQLRGTVANVIVRHTFQISKSLRKDRSSWQIHVKQPIFFMDFCYDERACDHLCKYHKLETYNLALHNCVFEKPVYADHTPST